MSPICFSTLEQPPIYLTKSITFPPHSSGTETTDVSSYNLGPNAVVLGGGAVGSYSGGNTIASSWNVELSSNQQTVNWNWDSNAGGPITLGALGAVILDFA